jgi:hypothetical protein
MAEPRNLRLIASLYCRPYATDAKAFIDEAHPSGQRHLIVRYRGNRPEFAAGIPDEWAENDVLDLIFWPIKNQGAPYPAWEVPARAFGSATLFAWWKGEKPR